MKVNVEKKEYRIAEGYGRYFNKRWEVQEKYFYYENGKNVEAWHMVFHSEDKNKCMEVMRRYNMEPQRKKISFDASVW